MSGDRDVFAGARPPVKPSGPSRSTRSSASAAARSTDRAARRAGGLVDQIRPSPSRAAGLRSTPRRTGKPIGQLDLGVAPLQCFVYPAPGENGRRECRQRGPPRLAREPSRIWHARCRVAVLEGMDALEIEMRDAGAGQRGQRGGAVGRGRLNHLMKRDIRAARPLTGTPQNLSGAVMGPETTCIGSRGDGSDRYP